jgi:serine/threonine-protein kinase
MNHSSLLPDGARAYSPPFPGDVVGGKYRLTRALGEGGMGVVFEAEHLRLRQSVAIKFLRTDVIVMPDAVERFEREARASCRMRGPHVVHVLDVDSDAQGRPYMVMEMLRGRDLEAELHARGALPVAEAVDWILQACAAVAEAHAAGIVHRDLKPSNLFVAEEAGTRVLKVLDFGISKIARDEPATTSIAVTVGTPLYMSPEQVRSSRDVDGATDIWSLGIILYELVAGTPPFRGTTTAAIAAIVADATPRLRDVRPGLPEELERALMTALAKAPGDRFPCVEAFAAALMPFASPEGIAGPFSFRPSRQAVESACSAMKRTPIGTHASDASDLLRLPSRAKQVPAAWDARGTGPWRHLRTLGGLLAVGVGVAAGVFLGTSSTSAPDRRDAAAPVRTATAPSTSTAPSQSSASPMRGHVMRPRRPGAHPHGY